MIGKTVSHYKIISKLGEGGMGVVYKAEDTRLDRHVAIKFLPSSLDTQDTAKKRFIHEAKAASSLEHPNICAVYDIGETGDGQMFIAMPHYDGETLEERIAQGPLEIAEVIDIVTQLASGLAKAHEQGIVHRDIKPGNIFITKDGHVKILDFGLAKLANETRLTKSGTTLGTIAYMSPEQASGGDVDARSDIFSLGVVFYELLTGALPFKGDHEAAIMYGILHNDPEPLHTNRNDIPEGLQGVVEKALAKNVDERFQSAQEFMRTIAKLGLLTGVREGSSSRSVRTGGIGMFTRVASLAVLGIAALAVAVFVVRQTVNSSGNRPASISATHTQLTFTGDAKNPIISPDRQFVAYSWEIEDEEQIVVRDIAGGEPIVVFEDFDHCFCLRWSPDGTRLLAALFTQDGERYIYIAPRLGGSGRRLPYYPYAAWSPDGRRVAASWHPWKKIELINVATGAIEPNVSTLEFSYEWLNDLDWSPDGSRLLVHVGGEDGGHEVWTVTVDGKEARRVIKDREIVSPRWAPTGRSIYYVVPKGATQSLFRVGIDTRSGQVTEPPAVILSGMTGLGMLSVTSDGKAITYARHIVDRDIWMFSTDQAGEDGNSDPRRLTSGTAVDKQPSLSPDGREIAFVRSMGEASDVFIVPAEGGAVRQLTFTNSECYSPVWSPKGDEIAYINYQDGKYCVCKVAVETTAAVVLGDANIDGEAPRLVWVSEDRMLYPTSDGRNYAILDPTSGEETRLLASDNEGWVNQLVVAPGRKRVAMCWNQENGGLWIISLADSSRNLVVRGHKDPFGWSPDGEWIYYYCVPDIARVRSDGTGEEVLGSLPFENVEMYPSVTMTPDAKRIVTSVAIKTPSDVWLVENFDPDIQ